MRSALVSELPDLLHHRGLPRLPRRGVGRNVGIAGKVGRIQIVSEIEPQRADGRLIAHANADGVGGVVVTALRESPLRRRLKTNLPVGLMKPPHAGEHFLRTRKHVAHILKNSEADVVVQVRHTDIGKTHLEIIEENSAAADGIPREGIAGPCLIQPESAIGVAPAAIKALGERNQSLGGGRRLRRIQQIPCCQRGFPFQRWWNGQRRILVPCCDCERKCDRWSS